MPNFLITNNGPHPPEKWAMTTSETIFDLSATSMMGESLLKAQKMRILIAECLLPHHMNVQSNEKKNLLDNDYIISPHDVSDYVEKATSDIVSISKGTPWESHFSDLKVQEAVKIVLANHFSTVQHIERLWYADTNASVQAKTYKAKFHG
jgi:hypothetical protein